MVALLHKYFVGDRLSTFFQLPLYSCRVGTAHHRFQMSTRLPDRVKADRQARELKRFSDIIRLSVVVREEMAEEIPLLPIAPSENT
ncbi:MAG: hypothetical protein GDA56_09510 [Hormoscilla sp. GM7CHS1pb]|nr:hypothetical protein [Hormoscilla sp. GM7CHS1pb]